MKNDKNHVIAACLVIYFLILTIYFKLKFNKTILKYTLKILLFNILNYIIFNE